MLLSFQPAHGREDRHKSDQLLDLLSKLDINVLQSNTLDREGARFRGSTHRLTWCQIPGLKEKYIPAYPCCLDPLAS